MKRYETYNGKACSDEHRPTDNFIVIAFSYDFCTVFNCVYMPVIYFF